MTSVPRGVVDHTRQTRYSDPGRWASLFDDVEPVIESVGRMSRNIIAHYRAQADQLPEATTGDVNLRWIDAILGTDQARHSAPLNVERKIGERVQGCCRDHTLLAVSALRHHGIPARSCVGFARYLSPTWNADHVIVEAWLEGRWRRFDPEFGVPFGTMTDPTDIAAGPDAPFLTAAEAWLGHRTGNLDVTRFGVAEGLAIGGDWFVYSYVVAQVAHRFGDELLLWDQWGAMTGDLSTAPADSVTLVDEIAELLVRSDADVGAEAELLSRYRDDDRLRPAQTIRTISPVASGIWDLDLDTRVLSPAT
jgi:transglutaminase superfamily protein